MADEKQRFYPRPTGNAEIDAPLQMLFKGLYDVHDAFTSQASEAQLVATVAAGAVTAVHVVKAGKYATRPSVTAIGGGGAGATFLASLNQDGGIRAVSVVSGGAGYTSTPALVVN